MAGIVAYFRVSTKRQSESGLGLEGQAAAVANYSRQTALPILATFTEVESGRRSDRPELAKALAFAKRTKATLIVAKLDRLSRNAAFLLTMLEGKVPFVCCDNPAANELTIGMLAVIAQHEAKMISDRTKSALQAAKARGALLGSARPGHWDGRESARHTGALRGGKAAGRAASRAADEEYRDLIPVVAEFRAAGMSLSAIAVRLTADGHMTRRGKAWNAMQVHRVLQRVS